MLTNGEPGPRATAAMAVALVLLMPFGCGGDDTESTSPEETASAAAAGPTELDNGTCSGANACQLESDNGEFRALVPAGATVTLDGQVLTTAPNPNAASNPGLALMATSPFPASALADANLDGLALARETARSNVTLPVRIEFADGTSVEGTHTLVTLDLNSIVRRLSLGVVNGTPLEGTGGSGLVFVSSATSEESAGQTTWSGTVLPAAGLSRWSDVGFIGIVTDVQRREVGTCNYRLADGTPEPATKIQLFVSARLVRANGAEVARQDFEGSRPSCPREMAAGARSVDGSQPDQSGVLRWLRAQAAEAE